MEKKKKTSKITPLIIGIFLIIYILFVSAMQNSSPPSNPSSEIQTYENTEIDLQNLEQYPFGKSLENVLFEIGVDDAIEAICEVDNSSGLTLRITTSSKRLWVGIDDYFEDERNVNWVRDYDSSKQEYYYLADNLSYYNEPIYSYKTGELLIDKIDGESQEYPLIITAEQLVNEINTNIDAAKEKYNGKWIKISGTVTFISKGPDMTGYYLYGKRSGEGVKITCWVNDINNPNLSVGNTATFVGLMREVTIMNNTELAYCELVN